MKRLITLVVIGAFGFAACGSSDGGSAVDTAIVPESVDDTVATDTPDAGVGVLFTAPTGDYTILFPGVPVRNDLSVPLPEETVVADAYIYEVATAAYFTSTFDYPEGLTDPDPTVVLEGARDGAVQNVGATLESSESIERNGIPGIAFTFGIDDAVQSDDGQNGDGQGGVGSAVVFFDSPRLYQSFALGESAGKADYQAFVDTFAFIDAPATETDS